MIVNLNNRALLKVSGDDAQTFLQGQLSNDIDAITATMAQINVYCQHQGKIIAMFWVMKKSADFYLSFPQDLSEIVSKRLQMFVMMADVVITDVSGQFVQLGVIDEDFENAFALNQHQSVAIINPSKSVSDDYATTIKWEQTCIEMGLAEVEHATSEKFVPQMLNLDIDEIGVNWSKGCYPGQEVVARLHYLGKPKRRLYQFTSDADICVGDELIVANSKSAKSSGIVVRYARLGQKSLCLATLEVAHKDDKVLLKNDENKQLTRIKNA